MAQPRGLGDRWGAASSTRTTGSRHGPGRQVPPPSFGRGPRPSTIRQANSTSSRATSNVGRVLGLVLGLPGEVAIAGHVARCHRPQRHRVLPEDRVEPVLLADPEPAARIRDELEALADAARTRRHCSAVMSSDRPASSDCFLAIRSMSGGGGAAVPLPRAFQSAEWSSA